MLDRDQMSADRRRDAGAGPSLLTSAISVLLPTYCAGCHRWDTPVCDQCRLAWSGPPRRCESAAAVLEGPAPLRIFAVAPYQHRIRRMIVVWKGGGRPDLTAFFATVAARAAGHLQLPDRVLIVPAPSGWRRRMSRRFVVGTLATAFARGAAAAGCAAPPAMQVRVADVLRTPNRSMHRASAGQRRTGRRVRTTPLARRLPRWPVVLVDDVVTTGATLAAANGALADAGLQVVGAFVLAATPRSGSDVFSGGALALRCVDTARGTSVNLWSTG